tara:strand:- start:9585 stop:10340 length:756 start_codon:yes stop_codon:yes gene_type:complete
MSNLIKSGFDLAPNNLNEAMNLAGMICNSQLCPPNYKGKQEDTLVAMMMGNELGLNPLQAIQNIAVINGRPSIYGDALMALVQNHPAFVSIEESFDDNTLTAVCTVKRKNGEKHTQRYSKQDAETAKLWGKQGPWSQYPKRMLAMRARGFALRNQFADALAGLITREEAEDMPLEKEINPTKAASNTPPAIEEQAYYSDEDFEVNFPKWAKYVHAGKKTPDDIITMVSSKAMLTDGQINNIKGLKKQEQAA